jgi:hypothetical protein
MGIIGSVFKLLFGKTIDDIFRGDCPECSRQGLEGHLDKCVIEGFLKDHTHISPAYFWRQCIYCGARFKKHHFGEALERVSDEEWEKNVGIPRVGGTEKKRPLVEKQ